MLWLHAQVWNTHNWTCHKDLVLGQGDEIWALAVVGDRLVSGSIDRYCTRTNPAFLSLS